jgi:hypothetical protein
MTKTFSHNMRLLARSMCLGLALLAPGSVAKAQLIDQTGAFGAPQVFWYAEYIVVLAGGQIRAWPPLQSKWTSVKKDQILPQGTIVQMHAGSRLALRDIRWPRGSGGFGRDLKLTASEDMVIRLNPDLVRDFQMKSLHLKSGVEDKTSNKSEASVELLLSQAWKRVAGIFSESEGKIHRARMRDKRKDTGGGGSDVKPSDPNVILVQAPLNGSAIIADQIPVQVPVVWRKADNTDDLWIIEYWRAGATENKLSVRPDETYAVLSIPTTGPWVLQISTRDRKWLSSAVPFLVVDGQGADLDQQ